MSGLFRSLVLLMILLLGATEIAVLVSLLPVAWLLKSLIGFLCGLPWGWFVAAAWAKDLRR